MSKLGEERNRLIDQRDTLATERDELQVHCRRADGDLAASLAREGHALKERDELQAHCRRISSEMAASLAREEHALKERDEAAFARDVLERERDEALEHCLRLSNEIEALERHASAPRPSIAAVLEEMRVDWDRRALENALHYTNSAQTMWDEDEYFSTGEANVREHVLNDMENVCQGIPPNEIRVLEIGQGLSLCNSEKSMLWTLALK